jgi:hypothetical protein
MLQIKTTEVTINIMATSELKEKKINTTKNNTLAVKNLLFLEIVKLVQQPIYNFFCGMKCYHEYEFVPHHDLTP